MAPKEIDTNKPYQEDEKIKDRQAQYQYRRARGEFENNKLKINNLISRFQNEISQNEKTINEYAK